MEVFVRNSGDLGQATLNQTNYAILAYNDVSPNVIGTASNFIVLRNTNNNNFRITSNVGWKATITEPTDIMEHTIPATGGTDNSAGGSTTSPDYTLTGKTTPSTKYETATILLEDNTTPKRAKDYTVTVVQCQGTEDMSSVTTDADNSATSTTPAPDTWTGKVVRHAAKTDVYEEFYSADFGTAGRWMTTNLLAKAYDSNVTNVTLPASPSASDSNTDPRWCYPNGASSQPSTWLNQQGLLYNWAAATGMQNSSTEQQGQVAGANPGTNEVETETSGAGYQGICPNGWHLPSDREWNELEGEIYTHPELYSSYTDKTGWSTENWSTWETSTGYRPSSVTEAHGKAMKDICGVNSTNPNGRSNSLANGGFSVLAAGYANGNSVSSFGTYANFWSSSSNTYAAGSNRAWRHVLDSGNAAVYREGSHRYYLYSVRCKKD